ncbi:MAG: HAMP domain-containing histidine kinase [Bacteroidales bacterium]|nr:HAMP domain-containing histidine kinase [Bacteroidales bacterium]
MNEKIRTKEVKLLFALTLLFLMIAGISGYFDIGERGRASRVKKLQKKVVVYENKTAECAKDIASKLQNGTLEWSDFGSKQINSLSKKNISVFVYDVDDQLMYWSDNSFDIPTTYDGSFFNQPIVFIQNGWFIPYVEVTYKGTVASLMRLTTSYDIENNIIKSGFVKNLPISKNAILSATSTPDSYDVFGKDGKFRFAVAIPDSDSSAMFTNSSVSFLMLSFLFLIILAVSVADLYKQKGKEVKGFILCVLTLLALYAFFFIVRQPLSKYAGNLFFQSFFSYSILVPSLGHLFVLSIVIFISSFVFYKTLPFPVLSDEGHIKEEIQIVLLFFFGTLLLCFSHNVFVKLISESSINFEPYKILDISYYSIIGFVSIVLLSFSSFLFYLKAFKSGMKILSLRIVAPLLLSVLVVVILSHVDKLSIIVMFVFLLVQMCFARLIVGGSTRLFILAVIYSLIISVYALLIIVAFSERKIDDNIKVQALAFSVENDPEAELLLLDIWPEIRNDVTLKSLMSVDYFSNYNFVNINDYLEEKYFNGYWDNFNISIYLCEEDQYLRLTAEREMEDCFTFFENRIKEHGHQIAETDFYFIDDMAGRTCYLGDFYFQNPSGGRNGLFIEIFGDVNVFQPGYSEVLLDRNFHGYAGLSDYSFAKYINGTAVLVYGDFEYKRVDASYVSGADDYKIFEEDNYRHVLLKNGNTTVIVSRESLSLSKIFISFAYLFVAALLCVNIAVALIKGIRKRQRLGFNLRQRFQFSMIGILFLFSILIGILMADITVNRYRTNHYNTIKEKMISVSSALENEYNEVGYFLARGNATSGLNDILVDISNIFNTDINFFSLEGKLLATSRPEVFNRNLVSTRMDNVALDNLKVQGKTEYINTERIGNMSYLSGYSPYLNSYGRTVAYINLPYFRMQQSYTKELSDMVVTIINLTLLLVILITSLAMFIIDRLTSPLSMLSKGLASVELGKRAEHIQYDNDDEIGDLIRQYNLMVDELDDSVTKLANYEREYAWREMARQIAHEIKNPLTPMKLNVQQLHRYYKDGAPDFAQRIETFAKNQIEYIDNLSSIATAFSSFAKMPVTKPAKIDIVEQVKTTVGLFSDTKGVDFEEVWPNEKVYVYADKEHLNGIVSNLIKNAIQAIPSNREGHIKVAVKVNGNKVIVSVQDNGSGVPEIIKEKIFTPNFTTKSSGTGLGLAIVKKYVENANGLIWFESEANKGTTFFVELPLMFTE